MGLPNTKTLWWIFTSLNRIKQLLQSKLNFQLPLCFHHLIIARVKMCHIIFICNLFSSLCEFNEIMFGFCFFSLSLLLIPFISPLVWSTQSYICSLSSLPDQLAKLSSECQKKAVWNYDLEEWCLLGSSETHKTQGAIFILSLAPLELHFSLSPPLSLLSPFTNKALAINIEVNWWDNIYLGIVFILWLIHRKSQASDQMG